MHVCVYLYIYIYIYTRMYVHLCQDIAVVADLSNMTTMNDLSSHCRECSSKGAELADVLSGGFTRETTESSDLRSRHAL